MELKMRRNEKRKKGQETAKTDFEKRQYKPKRTGMEVGSRWLPAVLLMLFLIGGLLSAGRAEAQEAFYVNMQDSFWLQYKNDAGFRETFWIDYFDEEYWVEHEDAEKTLYQWGSDSVEDEDDAWEIWYDEDDDSGDDDWEDDDSGDDGWYDEDEIDESIISQKVSLTSLKQEGEGIVIQWCFKKKSFCEFRIGRAVVASDGSIGDYTSTRICYYSAENAEKKKGKYYASTTDPDVEPGVTYSYRILGYYCKEDEDGNEENVPDYYTLPMAIKVSVGQTVISEVTSKDESGIVLKWEEAAFASGYRIYRAKKKDAEYQQIAEVGTKNRYYDQDLEFGSRYYYKVIAFYQKPDQSVVYGAESEVQNGTVTYSSVKIRSVQLVNVTTAKLTWDKYEGMEGYEIFLARYPGIPWEIGEDQLEFKKLKTIHDADVTSLTVHHLENGYTYFYKVRVIGKENGKVLKGEFSKMKQRTMNVLAYELEPWEMRIKRIFGKKKEAWYKSASEAQKHMKTIQIKAWDIGSSGKKYTRTFYLTVHEKIAPTVQQIFKEIYEGKEKFPIHDIGGYSWRGDNSTSEHCIGLAIDINANENYMIDGDTPKVGSLWKPGKNPYSIPLDGEVAKIMNKYGFTQGLWGNRRDYMHFSYFGT